jgi:hypothetical protein
VLDKKTRWIFFSQTSKNQPLGTPRRLRFWAKIAFFHYEPLPKRVSDFFFSKIGFAFFGLFSATPSDHSQKQRLVGGFDADIMTVFFDWVF